MPPSAYTCIHHTRVWQATVCWFQAYVSLYFKLCINHNVGNAQCCQGKRKLIPKHVFHMRHCPFASYYYTLSPKLLAIHRASSVARPLPSHLSSQACFSCCLLYHNHSQVHEEHKHAPYPWYHRLCLDSPCGGRRARRCPGNCARLVARTTYRRHRCAL